MRYIELIETTIDPVEIARNDIMDYIIPLKTQGITSITVNQVIDYLKSDMDLSNVNIDDNFVRSAVENIDNLMIITNSAGILTLQFEDDNTNIKPSNSSKEKVDKMAKSAAIKSL